MSKEQKVTLKEWLYITIGILIMTVGIYFFKFPNHFSTGGVTGIAIVLGHYIPSITPGTLVTIINIGLLILGFVAGAVLQLFIEGIYFIGITTAIVIAILFNVLNRNPVPSVIYVSNVIG